MDLDHRPFPVHKVDEDILSLSVELVINLDNLHHVGVVVADPLDLIKYRNDLGLFGRALAPQQITYFECD